MPRQEWVGIEPMGEVFLLTFLFIGLVRYRCISCTTKEPIGRSFQLADQSPKTDDAVDRGISVEVRGVELLAGNTYCHIRHKQVHPRPRCQIPSAST